MQDLLAGIKPGASGEVPGLTCFPHGKKGKSAMRIRPATKSDLMAVLAVEIAVYRYWSENIDFVPALVELASEIAVSIEQNRAWMVEMDDAVIGVARYDLRDGIATVFRFAIHPIHQRHGLGKKLLSVLEEEIVRQGGYAVEFRVPTAISSSVAFLLACAYDRVQVDSTWLLCRKILAPPDLLPGKRYRRTGTCERCGKCCSRIFLMHHGQSVTRQGFEALGEKGIRDLNDFTKTVGVDFLGELEDGTAYFRCRRLTFNSEGRATCTLYEQRDVRPPVCSMFPVAPSAYKYLSCGFSFEEDHE